MSLMCIHAVDARFDGALMMMAQAGGLAALPQLETYLDRPSRLRSLIRAVERHDFGARQPLAGATAVKALVLTPGAMSRLLDHRARVRPNPRGMQVAVQRFAYHLRTARPLLTPAHGAIMLVRAGKQALGAGLNALGDRIRAIKVEQPAEAQRLYERWSRWLNRYDAIQSGADDAEYLDAHLRVRGLYIDPLPTGPTLAYIDRFSSPISHRKALAVATRVGGMYETRTRVVFLVGSPVQRQAVERSVKQILTERHPPRRQGKALPAVIPDRCRVEVVDLETARFFVHPSELPALLDDRAALELQRLGRLGR